LKVLYDLSAEKAQTHSKDIVQFEEEITKLKQEIIILQHKLAQFNLKISEPYMTIKLLRKPLEYRSNSLPNLFENDFGAKHGHKDSSGKRCTDVEILALASPEIKQQKYIDQDADENF
jgi:hypothetical protein